MEKTFKFGKIAYDSPNRKSNLVTVDVRLSEDKFGRPALGISDAIWNNLHTDIICGGQCLDDLAEYELENQQLFNFLYAMWKKYHLNDMHAGTPEQEEAINKWKADGHVYDYAEACKYLESIGLYEVEYHGLEFNGMYKYGHGWLYQPIEEDDLDKLLKVLGLEKR